jgi:flagellar basal body-associated protein FliL
MKKIRFALVIIAIVAILAIGANIIYLYYLSSADTYQEDANTEKTAPPLSPDS